MKLTQHEINSPTWQKIEEHYAAQLSSLRARLEVPTIKEEKRVELAWRIFEIKNLLSLAAEQKVTVAD